MTAIKKEELAKLEEEYGLEAGDLSYQHRCSRIAAVMKGEDWEPPKKPEPKQAAPEPKRKGGVTRSRVERHPLYGKRLLITPLMTPDAKRNLAYDEPLGPEIVVNEYDAGKQLYDKPESVTNMVGDYEIVRRDESRQVIAKTTFPKIGTEISWMLGRELVPVVRGNDGKRGYIWSFPTQVVQVEDTLIQLYGLKTLIESVYPELLPKFSGKPMMTYIDGVTLCADIRMTEALLKETARKELIDERAGIHY